MDSKAQAWYIDFGISLLLFIFTLVVYFNYTSSLQNQEKGNLNVILTDAKSISSSLALSGYPTDWDNSTVIRIGIADDLNVNSTKLRTFKKLNYSISKNKFATIYNYFVYFVDDKGEVLNINGVCGAGYPLINTTYNIKSAYYYSKEDDSFLKDFMKDTFNADIYFEDNPDGENDLESLISNLSEYDFLVMEHPLLTGDDYNDYKDAFNNYSARGGLLMTSGELATSQGKNLVGADFYKKSGQAIVDRNSTVDITEQYFSFSEGESIVFAQAYYVENTPSAIEFTPIAVFNQDGKNAVAKWGYGNGTVYFLSDFDVSYFNGNFLDVVEDAVKGLIEGTCTQINLSLSINPKQLVKTERYLNYKDKVVKMVLYVWQ